MTGCRPRITEVELVQAFRSLGVAAGDQVVVHSSLSSIGWVIGGAETVVDALCATLGPSGTLAVPTFTYGAVGPTAFDRKGTPSETGAITEAVRQRAGACRSNHPTHSITAIGRGATELVREHPLHHSLGCDSPLHRLAQRGGDVLLIGVGMDRNSMIHVAERLAGLAYKGQTRTVPMKTAGGERDVEVSRPGCATGFATLEPMLREAELIAEGNVGEAPAMLMPADELIAVACSALSTEPSLLLCENADCWWCPEARRHLREAGV